MLNGLDNAFLRMMIEEQQDTDELPIARVNSMGFRENPAQSRERLGQLPLPEDIRVVQASWLALQNREEVTGVKHLRIALVAALMRCDPFAPLGQFDAVDISLDPNRAKGEGVRNAVTVLIEGHCLVFIGLRRLVDTRIKGPFRQGKCTGPILLESLSNGLLALGCMPVKIFSATLDQIVIKPIQALRTRDGRGQAALKIFDTILDSRLLVASGWHAEQRFEVVMAGKSKIPLV